jgi:hypothetical protein
MIFIIYKHTYSSSSANTTSLLKSAFSPLIPASFSPISRYPFNIQQQQTKRFLSVPYSGTGYIPTLLEADQNDVNRSPVAEEMQD